MTTPIHIPPPDSGKSGQPLPGSKADEVVLVPGLSLRDSTSRTHSTSDQLTTEMEFDRGLPPLLPPGNQKELEKWVSKIIIQSTPSTTGSQMVGGPLLDTPASDNPYLQPGIMAILGPMMIEMGSIFMKIILQSAEIQIKTMQATLAQALQAKELTEASGDARASQLEKDASMHTAKMAGAIANSVTAFASAAMTLYATKKAHEAGPKAVEAANAEREKANKSKLTEGEEFTVRTNAEQQHFQKTHSYIQSFATVTQSMTGAITEAREASLTADKAVLERVATQAQALAALLDKLTGSLQSTEQKASEEGKAASQYWQSLLELMKSFAQISSQFGSRN